MTISRLYLEDSIHSHAPQDYLLESNGEGGIRTHAPLRTNGFQDRLVMTTSIPLHLLTCLPLSHHLSDKMYSSTAFHCRQYFFQTFFVFFYFSYFQVFLTYVYTSISEYISSSMSEKCFPQDVCHNLCVLLSE